MKKVISLIICAVILAGCLSLTAFAKETDLMFSMKGAEGKPGDQVNVEVYVDKNIGTWAAKFLVNFDSKALKLIDIKNGEVFKDREFTKSLLTNNGYYIYYAQMDDPKENNTNTGLILTLTFEITDRVQNGYYNVWLTFPDNGVGWFFDAKDLQKDRTVPADKEVITKVAVVGSTVTPDAVTDEKGLISDEETKAPVTAYVTDAKEETVVDESGEPVTNESGEAETRVQTEIVTNESGEAETYIVASAKQEDIPKYETDAEGNFVKDAEGNYETYYEDADGNRVDPFATTEETTASKEEKEKEIEKQKEKEKEIKTAENNRKLILIASIVAVVVAAIIIIAVVTGGKKEKAPVEAEPKTAPETEKSEEESEVEPEEEKTNSENDEN